MAPRGAGVAIWFNHVGIAVGPELILAVAVEAMYTLGRIEPLAIDVALYGEYQFGTNGNPDVIEPNCYSSTARGHLTPG